MPITFVQASAGTAIITGTGTVLLTNCKQRNLYIVNLVERGTAEDFSTSNHTNTESLAGVAGSPDGIISGSGFGGILQQVHVGRVVRDGTISFDLTVGASGNDLYATIYEFSGVSDSKDGNGKNTVFENGTQPQARDGFASTGTSVSFSGVSITTNGTDRYAIVVGAFASNQAVADFTGESGADLTQPVAAFRSSTGATCTQFIQTARVPTKGTVIDNGAFTVTATDWVLCTFALLPATVVRQQFLDYDYSR